MHLVVFKLYVIISAGVNLFYKITPYFFQFTSTSSDQLIAAAIAAGYYLIKPALRKSKVILKKIDQRIITPVTNFTLFRTV